MKYLRTYENRRRNIYRYEVDDYVLVDNIDIDMETEKHFAVIKYYTSHPYHYQVMFPENFTDMTVFDIKGSEIIRKLKKEEIEEFNKLKTKAEDIKNNANDFNL